MGYMQAYIRNFADKDGKVWHREGGQNLPPEAPHLVVTTSDIEDLLPKPPMKPAADAVPWASSPMEGFNGRVGSIMPSDNLICIVTVHRQTDTILILGLTGT